MSKTTTITMLATISGSRNGEAWPQRGETISLPADEASHLIQAGLAAKGEVDADAAEQPAEDTTEATAAASDQPDADAAEQPAGKKSKR